jgi:ribonuclease HI
MPEAKKKAERLAIYCDGSCPKAYGVGGWAFVILFPGNYHTRSGAIHPATNQTMELAAALEALREVKRLKLRDQPLVIRSDSQYVVKGMMEWRERWQSAGYAGIANEPWWRLLHWHQERCADLEFQWVKGHSTHRWNNYVDRVAGQARLRGFIEYQKQETAHGRSRSSADGKHHPASEGRGQGT